VTERTKGPGGGPLVAVTHLLRKCKVCHFERVKYEGDEGGCPFCGAPASAQRDRSEAPTYGHVTTNRESGEWHRSH